MQKIHRPLVLVIGQGLYDIFDSGYYADKVIERLFKNSPRLGSRDRRFVAESIYEVVRFFRRYHFLIGEIPLKTPEDYLKIWAVYAFEKYQFKNDDFVTFDEKLYNEKIKKLKLLPAIESSWPDWIYERVTGELSLEEGQRLLGALNHQAPVDIRLNSLKCKADGLVQSLSQEGIEIVPIEGVPNGFQLKERKNVFSSEAFKKGWFEVQDRASQKVSPLLDPQPGQRVCDACAGAGGKSLHLSALMGNKGRVLSMDIYNHKLEELQKRARRSGASIIETRHIESSKVIKRQIENFDKVLLDVPCSGLGVVRRNPDTKWKLTPERLSELIELQAHILSSYSRLVKPGGTLVYATCSILPSENEKQVEKFMDQNSSQWTWESSWWSRLNSGEGDGFFAAKLSRS